MEYVDIKRGYEVLSDNNVRFGIRIINNSSSAILDVEVILDYGEDSFKLQSDTIQKLGTIPPSVPRTAKFILQPKGCIHKEDVGATIRYKDHEWNKHVVEMRPKEVHCVCPFLKEKSISRAEFLTLSKSGYSIDSGVNFENIGFSKVMDSLINTCKNRLYKVDEFPVENGAIVYFAGDAVGEKAYYLLTVVVKEYEGVTQVFLRGNSDKNYGLNGFLNETLDNLRHLVVVGSVREIGIIKKEQVINIIDSVVQRTIFGGGEDFASVKSVNIQDSVVQHTKFNAGEGRGVEEEKIRTKQEKKEREIKAKEELEGKKRQEKERKTQEKEEKKILREQEKQRKKQDRIAVAERERLEMERNARENKERIAQEAARKERERQKVHEEKERLRRQHQRNTTGQGQTHIGTSISKLIFTILLFALVIIFITNIGGMSTSNPEPASLNDQKYYTNSIGMEFALIPAGEFDMGPWQTESTDVEDYGPTSHQTIKNEFYIGKYEVTQKQWREVMPVYLFSWNEIPGTDSVKLIEILNQKFKIDWINTAQIEKIENGTTIRVFTPRNNLLLRLSPGKSEVNIILDDGRVDKFIGIIENNKLNIYIDNNPSEFKGDTRPIEKVSWDDAQEFIIKLNEIEGTDKYRLPSNAEWEYAARAGTTTNYFFGDSYKKLSLYAWHGRNSDKETHPVGQKKPNPWGLYDVCGNVGELVQDKWHSNYYGAPIDGSAWETNEDKRWSTTSRFVRGGSWHSYNVACKSAVVSSESQSRDSRTVGFRLLMEL